MQDLKQGKDLEGGVKIINDFPLQFFISLIKALRFISCVQGRRDFVINLVLIKESSVCPFSRFKRHSSGDNVLYCGHRGIATALIFNGHFFCVRVS
jgi:hypothetical protein